MIKAHNCYGFYWMAVHMARNGDTSPFILLFTNSLR